MIKYKELSQSKHRAYIVVYEEEWTDLLIHEARDRGQLQFSSSTDVELSKEAALSLINTHRIMKDVADDLIYQAIIDFINERGRNVQNDPRVRIGKLDKSGFEAVVDLEMSPLVSLANYKELDVITPISNDETAKARYKENILIALFEESEVIVNEDLLEEEMQNAILAHLSREKIEKDYKTYIEEQGLDYELHLQELKEDTIFRVSIQTLLYEIAGLEEIIVTESDLERTKLNIQRQFQIEENELKENFEQDYILNRALLEKTTDYLIQVNRNKKLLH